MTFSTPTFGLFWYLFLVHVSAVCFACIEIKSSTISVMGVSKAGFGIAKEGGTGLPVQMPDGPACPSTSERYLPYGYRLS